MTVYLYPGWRRVIFASVLVALVVISMAPSVTQGTVTFRMYGTASRGVVTHMYVGFSKVELHETGFSNSSGWVSITKSLDRVDLVSDPNGNLPQSFASALVHSARYDSFRITFSNATVMVGNRSTPLATPPVITANTIVTVPPNGNGDVFLVVGFDYLSVLAQPPSLTVKIMQIQSA